MKLFIVAILLSLKLRPHVSGTTSCTTGPDQICSNGYCYKVKGSTANRCPLGYALVKAKACTCASLCPNECSSSPCSPSDSSYYV